MTAEDRALFTLSDLEACFARSRRINQMRADIKLFVAIFMRPFNEQTLGPGAWESSPQNIGIRLEIPTVAVCAFNAGGIILRVYDDAEHRYALYQVHNGMDLPLHLVEPLWRVLPKVLDFICQVPRIRAEVEFYRKGV